MPGRMTKSNRKAKSQQCLFISLPVSPYKEVWKLQRKIVEAKVQGRLDEDVILALEHEPVFTLGRRGNKENLLLPEELLAEKGIDVVHVERGGDVTYHGPGQLVVYPIVDLSRTALGVVDFVEELEEVMIRIAADFDVRAERNPKNRGVWVGAKKLGSVGIAIRHGITYHGLAQNICNSLAPFSWINPCGLQNTMMTSISMESGRMIDMEEARASMSQHIEEVFSIRPKHVSPSVIYHRLGMKRERKPAWLRIRLPSGPVFGKTRALLAEARLHTVCDEAFCPNRAKCFSEGTATFLILGDRCTRNCAFCAVKSGSPTPPDPEEPARVAKAAAAMGLEYVVVTSVTRDDLPDSGADQFCQVVEEIRKTLPQAGIELLVPDFQGNKEAIAKVTSARPHVLNHNVETVPRLYTFVRPKADYGRSLELLARVKGAGKNIVTKSGLMLGLGERDYEMEKVLEDLLEAGCDILTLGQYLQPSSQHIRVQQYVRPEEFDRWKQKALSMGFKAVASGPLVRSSYEAKRLYEHVVSQSGPRLLAHGNRL